MLRIVRIRKDKDNPRESGATSGRGTPEQSHASILGGAEPRSREGRPKGRNSRGLRLSCESMRCGQGAASWRLWLKGYGRRGWGGMCRSRSGEPGTWEQTLLPDSFPNPGIASQCSSLCLCSDCEPGC